MFSFCNPFLVTNQVKASKVLVQDVKTDASGNKLIAEDPDSALMDTSMRSQTRPKPKFSLFRKASIQTLSDEIYTFVMDIRWNYETYQEFEKKLLGTNGVFLTYTFDFTPLSPKSKLVKMLRNEFELNPNISFTSEDVDNSLLNLALLLENYYEYPSQFDPTSPYNHNCFTSLEYAFICTDVFVAALWRHLLPPTAAPSTNNNNNTNSANLSINNNSNSTLSYEAHLFYLRKLVGAVLQLYALVGEDQRLACGVVLCQIFMKVIQVVHIMVLSYVQDMWHIHGIFKAIDMLFIMQETLSIVESVPSCGQLVSYLLTMKLWVLIDTLLRLINLHIIFAANNNTVHHMLHLYKNKVWKCATLLMSHSYVLIGAMQSQETQEIHPLFAMNEQGMERMIYDVIVSCNSSDVPKKMLALLTPSSTMTDAKTSILLPWSLQLNTSFHIRFLVMSMMKITHMDFHGITYRNKHLLLSSHSSIHSTQSLPPDIDRMMRVLYEVFVFTTKDKIIIERLFLAPTMAQLLLQMTALAKGHVQCQWIFWSLAKSLSEFNDWLKLRLRALRQRALSTTSADDVSVYDVGSGQGSSHAGSYYTLNNDNHHNGSAVTNPNRSTQHRTSFQSATNNTNKAQPYHRRPRKESEDQSSVDEVLVVRVEDGEDAYMTEPISHSLSMSPTSSRSSRKIMMVSASAPGLVLSGGQQQQQSTYNHHAHHHPMNNSNNSSTNNSGKHNVRVSSLMATSASQPTLAPSSAPVAVSKPAAVVAADSSSSSIPVYKVGDIVDGNVTLSNGTQRWFPGKITAVHSAGSAYDILYEDGDKGSHVAVENVRLSKRRVRTKPAASQQNSAVTAEGNSNPVHLIHTTSVIQEATEECPTPSNMLPILSPQAVPSTLATVVTDVDTVDIGKESSTVPLLKPIPVTFASTKSTRAFAAAEEVSAEDSNKMVGGDDAVPLKRSHSPDLQVRSGSSEYEQQHHRNGGHNRDHGVSSVGIAGAKHAAATVPGLSLDLQEVTQVDADDDVDKDDMPEASEDVNAKDRDAEDTDNSNGENSDDDDDDDHIFEIPSIFDQGHRVNNGSHLQHREDLVPRMQFANLSLTSSGIHAAGGMSLSAALLPDDDTTASSSFMDTPSNSVNNNNNSLYNLNVLKVHSGRQTPSFVLGSHRGGSVLNTAGALSTTRSIVTTHRSQNNDQFGGSGDDSYYSIHRNSHHNIMYPYVTPTGSSSGTVHNNSVSSGAPSSTPSHLHIGNFHSALQHQQQQQMPPHIVTPSGGGGGGGNSANGDLPTTSTRVLTWRGSANSMPHAAKTESPSSRITSSRTMMLHSNIGSSNHHNNNNNTNTSSSTATGNAGGSLSSRPPSMAPPDQLLTASQETRHHLQHKNSSSQPSTSASAPNTTLKNRSMRPLSRQNSNSQTQNQQASAGTGNGVGTLSNLSPSKRGLLGGGSSSPTHPHQQRMRSPSPDSTSSSAHSKHAMSHAPLHPSSNNNNNVMTMMHTIPDETLLLEEQVAFRLLLQTHLLMSIMLVEFTVHQEEYYDSSSKQAQDTENVAKAPMLFQQLKYPCCVSQEHVSAATLAALTQPTPFTHNNHITATTASAGSHHETEMFTLPPSHRINILFHIREFLELCPELWKEQDMLGMFVMNHHTNIQQQVLKETAFERVLKLLSPMFFPQEHMQRIMQTTGERIGDGGFGSVYKMQVSLASDGYIGLSHCLACYLQTHIQGNKEPIATLVTPESTLVCTCWRSTIANNETKKPVVVSMAVKRIARERSMFDESTLYALYQELTCLQELQACVGVCGLEHYGVCGSEYWLIMENGRQNLLDWRVQYSFSAPPPLPLSPLSSVSQAEGAPTANTKTKKNNQQYTEPLSPASAQKRDLFLFLLLWQDVLLIVDSLHRADIGHFDLKACNFLLRQDPRPYLAQIVQLHAQQQMSGFVFLADFGEAIPAISHPKNEALRRKCRGTLAIQSPEMLCISEDAENTVGVHSGLTRGFGSSTHLRTQTQQQQVQNTVNYGRSSSTQKPQHHNIVPAKDAESVLLQQMNRHGALGDHIADHANISLVHWIRNGSQVAKGTNSNNNHNNTGIAIPLHHSQHHHHHHDHQHADEEDGYAADGGIWQIARTTPISLASPLPPLSSSAAAAAQSGHISTPSKGIAAANIPRFSPELDSRNKNNNNYYNKDTAATTKSTSSSLPRQRLELGLPTKQSDLWSLGSLLVELLTGKMLFEEAQWVELFTCLCIKPISAQEGGVLQAMKHHTGKIDAIFANLLQDATTTTTTTHQQPSSLTPSNSSRYRMKRLSDDLHNLLHLVLQQRPDDRATPVQLFQETERILHLHFVAEMTEWTNQSQCQSPMVLKKGGAANSNRNSNNSNSNINSNTAAHAAKELLLLSATKEDKKNEESCSSKGVDEEIAAALQLQCEAEEKLLPTDSTPLVVVGTAAEKRQEGKEEKIVGAKEDLIVEEEEMENMLFWERQYVEHTATTANSSSSRCSSYLPTPQVHCQASLLASLDMFVSPVQERVMILEETLAAQMLRPLLATHAQVVKQRRVQAQGRVRSSSITHRFRSNSTANSNAAAASAATSAAASTAPASITTTKRNMAWSDMPTLSAMVDQDTTTATTATSATAAAAVSDNTTTTTTMAESLTGVLHLQHRWQQEIEALLPAHLLDHAGDIQQHQQPTTHHHHHHNNTMANLHNNVNIYGHVSRSRCNSATSVLSTGSGTVMSGTGGGGVLGGGGGGIIYHQHPPNPTHTIPPSEDHRNSTTAAAAAAAANHGQKSVEESPLLRMGHLSVMQRQVYETLYARLRREVIFTVNMTLVALPTASSTAATYSGTTTINNNNNNNNNAMMNMFKRTNSNNNNNNKAYSSHSSSNNNTYHQHHNNHNNHNNNNMIKEIAADISGRSGRSGSVSSHNSHLFPYLTQSTYANYNNNNNSSSQNNSVRRPTGAPHLSVIGPGISGISLSIMSSASNSISRVSHHNNNNNNSSNNNNSKYSYFETKPSIEEMQQSLMCNHSTIGMNTNSAAANNNANISNHNNNNNNSTAVMNDASSSVNSTAIPVKKGIIVLRFCYETLATQTTAAAAASSSSSGQHISAVNNAEQQQQQQQQQSPQQQQQQVVVPVFDNNTQHNETINECDDAHVASPNTTNNNMGSAETTTTAAAAGEDLWTELSSYGDAIVRVITIPLPRLYSNCHIDARDNYKNNDNDKDNDDNSSFAEEWSSILQKVLLTHRARLQNASFVLVTFPQHLPSSLSPQRHSSSSFSGWFAHVQDLYEQETTLQQRQAFLRQARLINTRNNNTNSGSSSNSNHHHGMTAERDAEEEPELKQLAAATQQPFSYYYDPDPQRQNNSKSAASAASAAAVVVTTTALQCWWLVFLQQRQQLRTVACVAANVVSASLTIQEHETRKLVLGAAANGSGTDGTSVHASSSSSSSAAVAANNKTSSSAAAAVTATNNNGSGSNNNNNSKGSSVTRQSGTAAGKLAGIMSMHIPSPLQQTLQTLSTQRDIAAYDMSQWLRRLRAMPHMMSHAADHHNHNNNHNHSNIDKTNQLLDYTLFFQMFEQLVANVVVVHPKRF